jgi:hypothetical protein
VTNPKEVMRASMAGKDGSESVLVTRQTARSMMALGIEYAEDDGDDAVLELMRRMQANAREDTGCTASQWFNSMESSAPATAADSEDEANGSSDGVSEDELTEDAAVAAAAARRALKASSGATPDILQKFRAH